MPRAIVPFDGATARVLDVLDEQGVFDAGVTLVGTNAFLAYQGALGVRWSSAARTADIDIASEINVALASPVDLLSALDATGLPFDEIPSLNPKTPSTSFKVRRKDLRVDVLVPLVGKPSKGPIRVPGLNVCGTPLRFLDYLIDDPMRVALPCRRGLLVSIPAPARFAFHKLIVSQERPVVEHNKRVKDVAQAAQLLDALVELRPGDLPPAWEELKRRGKGWISAAGAGWAMLPDATRAGLAGLGVAT